MRHYAFDPHHHSPRGQDWLKHDGNRLILARDAKSSMKKHRGIEYTLVKTAPDVWKWSVMIGDPLFLRIGDAPTEHRAEIEVWRVIDRAITVQGARLKPPNRTR